MGASDQHTVPAAERYPVPTEPPTYTARLHLRPHPPVLAVRRDRHGVILALIMLGFAWLGSGDTIVKVAAAAIIVLILIGNNGLFATLGRRAPANSDRGEHPDPRS